MGLSEIIITVLAFILAILSVVSARKLKNSTEKGIKMKQLKISAILIFMTLVVLIIKFKMLIK